MDRYAVVASLTALLKLAVNGRMRFVALCALMQNGSASAVAGVSWIGMLATGVQLCLRTLVLSTLGDRHLLLSNLLPSAHLAVVVTPLVHPLYMKGRIDTPLDGTSRPS